MSSQPRLFCDARVVAGRFRLVRLLGEGGMGVVWEVVELSTGQRRAAKFIRDEDRSEMMVRRLLKEAQAVSAIQHPNVVRVAEVAIDDDGTPVIVMEFLEGETLGERLEREGCLSVGQAAAIMLCVASALRAAHAAGVIHRDLKPDNIFLTIERGRMDVRVLDFGIAKHSSLQKDSLSVTGTLLGTPLYMSPEQAAGERDLDARTDIWSIAVILFECLTGTTPVDGDNFGQILTRLIRQDVARLSVARPDLPAALVALVDGSLVVRADRNVDLAPIQATLLQYADPEIAQPRTVVKSDPHLASAGRHDSYAETVGLPVEPKTLVVPPKTPGTARTVARVAIVAASAGLIFLLVGAGWYSVRASTRTTPSTSGPAVAASSADHAEPALNVGPNLAATAVAPVSSAATSAAASAKRPTAPSPRATGSPPTVPASAAGKPGAPPTRLQGGVAGDVPF